MVSKNTICLWYDRTALDAATFYAKTLPDSAVGAVHRAPGDYPAGKQGDVLTVEFTVMGIPCLGLNGGPGVPHTDAFSFQVATDDQGETDRLWNAIIGNGGEASACGWWQGQVGSVVADHPARPDRRCHLPGPRRRQARVRCHDGDDENRHRRDRGRAARLTTATVGPGDRARVRIACSKSAP